MNRTPLFLWLFAVTLAVALLSCFTPSLAASDLSHADAALEIDRAIVSNIQIRTLLSEQQCSAPFSTAVDDEGLYYAACDQGIVVVNITSGQQWSFNDVDSLTAYALAVHHELLYVACVSPSFPTAAAVMRFNRTEGWKTPLTLATTEQCAIPMAIIGSCASWNHGGGFPQPGEMDNIHTDVWVVCGALSSHFNVRHSLSLSLSLSVCGACCFVIRVSVTGRAVSVRPSDPARVSST
jgi:hypothetical protein